MKWLNSYLLSTHLVLATLGKETVTQKLTSSAKGRLLEKEDPPEEWRRGGLNKNTTDTSLRKSHWASEWGREEMEAKPDLGQKKASLHPCSLSQSEQTPQKSHTKNQRVTTSIHPVTQQLYWSLVLSTQFGKWDFLELPSGFMTCWGGVWREFAVQTLPGGNYKHFIAVHKEHMSSLWTKESMPCLRGSKLLEGNFRVDLLPRLTSQVNPSTSQICPWGTQHEDAVSCPPLVKCALH